jgi:hypothetical protein
LYFTLLLLETTDRPRPDGGSGSGGSGSGVGLNLKTYPNEQIIKESKFHENLPNTLEFFSVL